MKATRVITVLPKVAPNATIMESRAWNPENPMTVGELEKKFEIQALSVGLNESKIRKIVNLVSGLEKVGNMSELTSLLRS